MIHKAKKSLGQNFLKSEEALRAMISSGNVLNTDTIVEIGPGKGALTERLLAQGATVIAIEKDRDLLDILKDRFKDEVESNKLKIIYGDILEFDGAEYGLKEGEYKIIANIPYNITGSIIRKFLSETIQPKTMVLLVQKEVAMRIVARDNKESILSLSVKAYGDPKYVMKVGKRFFTPSPKVDSAIIAINNISKSNFQGDKKLEDKFFEVIRASFAHKRKVLRKNLEDVADADMIEDMFKELSIDAKARAEDLPFPTWLRITEFLHR